MASARNGIRIRLTMNPGRSADTMTCLPSSPAIVADRRLRRVVGGRASDQLDQRHHRHGAEEVHADEPGPARVRPTASARRSIEIDDVFEAKTAAAGAIPSSSAHSARLHVDVLEHRLDDEVRVRRRAEVVCRHEAGERRVAILRGEPALRDRPLEVGRNPVTAGHGARKVRLVERRRACRSPRGPARSRCPSGRRPRRTPAPRSCARAYAAGSVATRDARRTVRRTAPSAATAAPSRNAPP